MLLETVDSMPTEEHFARNFLYGRWEFPAAPYDFEIRNPSDSTVTAVVPLSSRFDTDRAISAAQQALSGPWAQRQTRDSLLARLINRLDAHAPELAKLQATETGVSHADSLTAIDATLRIARQVLAREVLGTRKPSVGVSGHILSWGMPFSEMLLSVFPALVRGNTVVVKPSLRGALSPVAVAHMASELGFPPGVINVVQGTGVDVGAALISSSALGSLHVHGNELTHDRARRASVRTHVPLHTLYAGGNAAIMYPGVGADQITSFAVETATAVRMNSAGGPFGVPIVAVHRDVALPTIRALLREIATLRPAPLPSELLRRRAMDRVHRLVNSGGRVLFGGAIPDDIEHRMGWRMPATVIDLGDASGASTLLASAGEPLGPVLTIVQWSTQAELNALFDARRHRDGYAGVWGDDSHDDRIRFGVVTRGQGPVDAMYSGLVPAAWTGDLPMQFSGATE